MSFEKTSDINAFWSDYGGKALSAMRKEVVGDFKKEFPNVAFSANSTVAGCIRLVYERARIPFVVIFDEYDVIFRERKADCLIESYLALLNGLFKSSTMSPCFVPIQMALRPKARICGAYPAIGYGRIMYSDIAIPFKPDIPAIAVELKVNGSVCTALDQIREKRYFAGLDKYEGNILLVGISYDRKTKKHECQIEKA